MNPRERANAVKLATDSEWGSRQGTKLEKTKGNRKLVVAKAPEFIEDKEGNVIGVDAWVQLFDDKGRELPIDPHRRIINPPTVPRSGIRLVESGRPVMERVLTPDPVAAFWESVWDSVENVPNEKGWRTRGTVTTVFGDISDGSISSGSTSYSTARAGGSLFAFSGGPDIIIGQRALSDYLCFEGFVSFDTSAIPDSDVVSAVSLELALNSDRTTTDFILQVRDYDWGASLTASDWVAGASLTGLTLVASLETSSIGAEDEYKAFASETAFLSVTNLKTGTVHLLINSSRHAEGNAPFEDEFLEFHDVEESGTTFDPKLTITHASAGSSPFFQPNTPRVWRVY